MEIIVFYEWIVCSLRLPLATSILHLGLSMQTKQEKTKQSPFNHSRLLDEEISRSFLIDIKISDIKLWCK